MKFSKFFSSLQESPWYREFLNPVLDLVEPNSRLLDIGTGSGKMLEILSNEKNVTCIGTDTSEDMLKEAKMKLINTNVELKLTPIGEALPFEKKSFDYISVCSVFFHLEKEEIDRMLQEYLSLLKDNGEIIILTPTGKGNVLKLTKNYFSVRNKGIYVWYKATKKRARIWTKEKYLAEFSKKYNLNFKREVVMNGFAHLEVIEK